MAINKNHEFEELEGMKCAIVEKDVKQGRVQFLKDLLSLNGYTVVTIPSPAPKTAAKPAPVAAAESEAPPPPLPASETFTVGVTDVTFNPTNAVYGRQLRTRNGHIVTPAYWHQKEAESHDEIPYFKQKL